MELWDRLMELLRMKRPPGPRYFGLDEEMHMALVEQANREQVRPEELAAELMRAGLVGRRGSEELWRRWDGLARREHDMIALTCLGYTNRQIAARLDIAPDTVNWYIRRLLVKLDLHSKSELKMLFEGWDFSGWEKKE